MTSKDGGGRTGEGQGQRGRTVGNVSAVTTVPTAARAAWGQGGKRGLCKHVTCLLPAQMGASGLCLLGGLPEERCPNPLFPRSVLRCRVFILFPLVS